MVVGVEGPLAEALTAFRGPREAGTKKKPKATERDDWQDKSGKRRGGN